MDRGDLRIIAYVLLSGIAVLYGSAILGLSILIVRAIGGV